MISTTIATTATTTTTSSPFEIGLDAPQATTPPISGGMSGMNATTRSTRTRSVQLLLLLKHGSSDGWTYYH